MLAAFDRTHGNRIDHHPRFRAVLDYEQSTELLHQRHGKRVNDSTELLSRSRPNEQS
jgi:hypothetical protein